MCPSYSFFKSASTIAVFQWFEKNKISANSCKDFSVKLVVKASRKRMRLSADSGLFLSVAGSKQTLIITLMFFCQQTVYKNKEFSWSYCEGMAQSRWIDMREKNMHPSKLSIYFLCVYQIDTCSSSYSSLESWSMTFFFCFPNAKQRYPFLIFAVIIKSICFMLARPMKQKILHNVFFQQLHKGNMHTGRDYLFVITGEGIVSVAELLSITPVLKAE